MGQDERGGLMKPEASSPCDSTGQASAALPSPACSAPPWPHITEGRVGVWPQGFLRIPLVSEQRQVLERPGSKNRSLVASVLAVSSLGDFQPNPQRVPRHFGTFRAWPLSHELVGKCAEGGGGGGGGGCREDGHCPLPPPRGRRWGLLGVRREWPVHTVPGGGGESW